MKKKTFIITGLMIAAIGAGITAKVLNRPEKISTFSDNVTAVNELTVPENARVIALGEATHGNSEFQQLKLTVFKRLVETTNVRALIIEGDFGGCALANEYINGGEGTAEEVTKKLGYRIYHTDEMCELVEWMHDYNETAAEDDKVRLYGADIQNDMCNVQLIKDFYAQAAPDKAADYSAKFDELFGTEEDSYNIADYDEMIELIDDVAEDMDKSCDSYEAAVGKEKFETVRNADEMLRCYLDYREKERFSAYYRDTKMKENVERVLEIEEKEHNGRLMLACHNGHMSKNQSTKFTFLGKFLHEEMGNEYFAIGTDFYISRDNLPSGNDGSRKVHKFCSDDPLAYQAKQYGKDGCYLDMTAISESDPMYHIVNSPMKTGTLGEQYNIMMRLLKQSYQLNYAPTEMYDAMILIYETSPVEIWQN
ncbi:MAG TPA: erythromycin esterase family protein [Ruminococcus sp.]|nr:erythromycin esterase family protein [Ruminococcus sp.]